MKSGLFFLAIAIASSSASPLVISQATAEDHHARNQNETSLIVRSNLNTADHKLDYSQQGVCYLEDVKCHEEEGGCIQKDPECYIEDGMWYQKDGRFYKQPQVSPADDGDNDDGEQEEEENTENTYTGYPGEREDTEYDTDDEEFNNPLGKCYSHQDPEYEQSQEGNSNTTLTAADVQVRYNVDGFGVNNKAAGDGSQRMVETLGVIHRETFDNLKLFSQFAAAAYCHVNTVYTSNIHHQRLYCPAKNCPLVEQSNAYATLKFDKIGNYHTTGYVGVDELRKLIIVSFRGSGDHENWNGSFNFGRKTYDIFPGCVNCRGHTGFLELWESVRGSVSAEVRRLLLKHGHSFQVVGTGHSLGGALATIAMADIRAAGISPKAKMYSYGAPRVGNIHLSQWISDQKGNYRVTHKNDMVPRVPPMVLGYVHISPEYHIYRTWSMRRQDVSYFNAASHQAGNRGLAIMGSRSQHRWYWGWIAACRRPEKKWDEIYDINWFRESSTPTPKRKGGGKIIY